jgi:hypothetical protein
MTREEVEAILGKPDDVRTKYDPGGIRRAETEEIWRHGTNGHLTTATLGSIYIDGNGKVQAICDKEKAAEAISRLKLRWDGKKQDYTFADGTTPRIDRPGPYRRNIWEPDILDLNLTLTIERINRKAIEVSVIWTRGEQELQNQPAVIRIYNASDRSLPVAQFKIEYHKNGSSYTHTTIKYEEGQTLIAVFAGAKTTAQSPEYKP